MHNIRKAPNQIDISPWNSQQDDNEIDKIKEKDIKLAKNIVKGLSQNIEMSKQNQLKKFHTIIQQHRERLSKKHERLNTKSMWRDSQKDKKYDYTSTLRKKVNQEFQRSSTANKFTQQIENLRIIKPNITQVYQYQRQIIKSFYRPKSTTPNADKFYGHINKNIQLCTTDYLSQTFNKTSTPILIQINKKKFATKSLSSIQKLKSIVQIKLQNYSSYRSIEKIKQSEKIKKRKINNKNENHILDRILTKN